MHSILLSIIQQLIVTYHHYHNDITNHLVNMPHFCTYTRPNHVQVNETYTTQRRWRFKFSKNWKQNFELRSYDPISALRTTFEYTHIAHRVRVIGFRSYTRMHCGLSHSTIMYLHALFSILSAMHVVSSVVYNSSTCYYSSTGTNRPSLHIQYTKVYVLSVGILLEVDLFSDYTYSSHQITIKNGAQY